MIHIIYIYFIVAALMMGFSATGIKTNYKDVFIIPILWLPYLLLLLLKDLIWKLDLRDAYWSIMVLLGIYKFENFTHKEVADIKIRLEKAYAEVIDSKPKIIKYLLTKAFNKLGLKVK